MLLYKTSIKESMWRSKRR